MLLKSGNVRKFVITSAGRVVEMPNRWEQCRTSREIRDVMMFEFKVDNIRTFSTDSKFDKCFKCFVV